jgi:hypothetical protein
MGIIGKGFVALVVAGAVVSVVASLQTAGIVPSSPPPKPKTEADEAIDQCRAAIAVTFGAWSIESGPSASDKWRDHDGKGSYDSLWTIDGKNGFGMPVENTIECEAGTKSDGSWGLPFLWNVTTHDNRLDPGTVAREAHRTRHRRHLAQTDSGG